MLKFAMKPLCCALAFIVRPMPTAPILPTFPLYLPSQYNCKKKGTHKSTFKFGKGSLGAHTSAHMGQI